MIRIVAIPALCALLLSSCASTRLISTWAEPSFRGRSIKRLLIIGVAESEGVRRSFESMFVEELTRRGVSAQPSADRLPSGRQLKEGEIAATAAAVSADAVLITHLEGVTREQRWNPPSHATFPDYYGAYYPYYSTIHDHVHAPGYYTTHTRVFLETNIYDVAQRKLIWSARSETFDPSSEKGLIRGLVKAVTNDLREQGMLAP